jgi:hypothetical protein
VLNRTAGAAENIPPMPHNGRWEGKCVRPVRAPGKACTPPPPTVLVFFALVYHAEYAGFTKQITDITPQKSGQKGRFFC